MEFYELRNQAGLLNSDAATLFKTSKATIRRWNTSNSPEYILDKLRLMTGHDPHWKNIKVLQGQIVTSTGYQLTSNQIENIEYRNILFNQLISLCEHQNKRLSRTANLTKSSNDETAQNVYQQLINRIP